MAARAPEGNEARVAMVGPRGLDVNARVQALVRGFLSRSALRAAGFRVVAVSGISMPFQHGKG